MTSSLALAVHHATTVTPGRPDPGERARTEEAAEDLLRRMRRHEPGSPAHRELREQVIMLCLPMAERLVRRYRGRGEPLEDLRQVAALSLVNAVDRYDPELGDTFVGFAIPTILGEVKRHFRDRTWSVHVPRRYQELRGEVAHATETLGQRLRRPPTTAELAEHLHVRHEEIDEARHAGRCYDALSLDGSGVRKEVLADEIGTDDANFARAEAQLTLVPALRRLPEREQRILCLRFFENLTQTEIAERVGLSQMHVSRLIRDSLELLRSYLGRPVDA